MIKIISSKLYKEYTKEVIGFEQDYTEITKMQLYEIFKFHCANIRIKQEVVEYIYGLIQKDKLERGKE